MAACDPFRMQRLHAMQRHDAGSLGIPQGDSQLLLQTTFTTTSLERGTVSAFRGGPFQRLEGDRFSVENYRNSHPQRELIEGRLAGRTVNPPG